MYRQSRNGRIEITHTCYHGRVALLLALMSTSTHVLRFERQRQPIRCVQITFFFVSSHSLPSKKEKVPRSANKLPHTMQCTQQQQQHKHKHNASLSFMKHGDDVASHACGVCAHCLFAVCYATNTVWRRPVMVSSQLKNLFANKLSNNKLKSFRGIWKQKWRRKPKATKKKNY